MRPLDSTTFGASSNSLLYVIREMTEVVETVVVVVVMVLVNLGGGGGGDVVVVVVIVASVTNADAGSEAPDMTAPPFSAPWKVVRVVESVDER